MSAADDDGAGRDEHEEALAFFDREATAEVDVSIDERARRSSPPPAVAVAPAVGIGPAPASISPNAPTRTYGVVVPGDAPPSELLEELRRSDAPTERHATFASPAPKPIALEPSTPTRLGLPRIDGPESTLPADEAPVVASPDPPSPALPPVAARAPRPRRQLPRIDSGVLRTHGELPRPRRLPIPFAVLALCLVAVAIATALLR